MRAKLALETFAQSVLASRAPHQAARALSMTRSVHSIPVHSAAQVIAAKYQPPRDVGHLPDFKFAQAQGHHAMYTATLNGTKHYIKRISLTPYEVERNLRERNDSGLFEGHLKDEEKAARFETEKEVFKTSLLQLMIGEHTRANSFVATAKDKEKDYSFYYVAGTEIPDFESLASFKNAAALFAVDKEGRTIFNHPEKGAQLITGRILVKTALYILGETDPNIENLALGSLAPDGRRRVVSIDHEGCDLRPSDKHSMLEGLRSDHHITSVFPALNLSNLQLTHRKGVKEQAVLHLDRVFNSEEGQSKIKALIINIFSTRSPHIMKHEIYEPLANIAAILKEAAAEIRHRNSGIEPPAPTAAERSGGTSR